VTTKSLDASGPDSNEPSFDYAAVKGIEHAIKLAKSGRLISAIKHLEFNNLDISRERAKSIVYSFGYVRESQWPGTESLSANERNQLRRL
jgi:hypothetical protein